MRTNHCTNHHNSHTSNAMRIQTPVRKISYWQIMLTTAYLLAIGLIALLASVAWWVLLLLLVISLVLIVVMSLYQSPLIHLTSPQLYHQKNKQQKLWQLLFAKPKKDQLWEAKLIHCRDFGRCIQLSFMVTHPLSKTLHIVLWQDQIDSLSWRRLKVLSRW